MCKCSEQSVVGPKKTKATIRKAVHLKRKIEERKMQKNKCRNRGKRERERERKRDTQKRLISRAWANVARANIYSKRLISTFNFSLLF
ncbi:hypothetical protein ABEB36_005088 [Hypothenemus hampei]